VQHMHEGGEPDFLEESLASTPLLSMVWPAHRVIFEKVENPLASFDGRCHYPTNRTHTL